MNEKSSRGASVFPGLFVVDSGKKSGLRLPLTFSIVCSLPLFAVRRRRRRRPKPPPPLPLSLRRPACTPAVVADATSRHQPESTSIRAAARQATPTLPLASARVTGSTSEDISHGFCSSGLLIWRWTRQGVGQGTKAACAWRWRRQQRRRRCRSPFAESNGAFVSDRKQQFARMKD